MNAAGFLPKFRMILAKVIRVQLIYAQMWTMNTIPVGDVLKSTSGVQKGNRNS